MKVLLARVDENMHDNIMQPLSQNMYEKALKISSFLHLGKDISDSLYNDHDLKAII